MTPGAEDRRVGQLRNNRAWIFGVSSQSPVTGLASDAGVLAFVLLCSDIAVAGLAGFAACKLDLPRPDFIQSGRAKMPVLTEVRGDDRPADEKEAGNP